MNKLTAVALSLAVVLLTGCAASGSGSESVSDALEEVQPSDFDYFPPEASPEVENSFEVNDRFEVVWERIINSASDGLKVESADKESGLVTLSYSADDATQYVDCGRSYRTFDFQGASEEYRYPTAADASFKEMGFWELGSEYKPGVRDISQDVELEGVIEVSVTPQDTMANLSVEAVYDLTVLMDVRFKKFYSMEGDSYSGSSGTNWTEHDLPTIEFPSFKTGESADETLYEGEKYGEVDFETTYTCIPKGTLEARVLEIAES